jgi:hypothetical protein
MSLKEHKSFTGFKAYYDNGVSVKEKENYFSKDLNKICATNWIEIDKKKLVALELLWNDQSIIKLDKTDYPTLTPDCWFFSQSAIFEMKGKKLTILSRNIGYKKIDGTTQVYSVEEATGRLVSHVKI